MAFEHGRSQHKRENPVANNDPVNKKYKKNEELRELALQDISILTNEIHLLEEEIFRKDSLCAYTYPLEYLETIETELLNADLPSSSKENNSGGKEKEIYVINERLRSLERLTGVKLIENSTKMLSKTDITMVLLQRITGTCHRIPFTVEFEVKEQGNMDSLLRSKECLKDRVVELTRLHVNVKDHLAEQELAQFMEKVQEDKSLQPFFFGLIQYAEWHSNRQRTFDHFKMKYPEIVHLTNTSSASQCLKLYYRNKPGLVFTLLWKLVIGESGHVTSDVQIHASAPVKHIDQRDKYSLLRSVPKQFHKVLPFLGIEQAVEVVIGMLCR